MLRQLSTRISQFSFSRLSPHIILGVKPNASPKQIKYAFYELAKIHHPDVNSSNSSSTFASINQAYQSMLKQHQNPKQPYSEAPKNQKSQKKKPSRDKPKRKYYEEREWERRAEYERTQDDFQDQQEWVIDEADVKEFEKAFNSYIRHGYLKQRFQHLRDFFKDILGQEIQVEPPSKSRPQPRPSKKRSEGPSNKDKSLNITKKVNLDLDELGSEKRIKVERMIICPKCQHQPEKNYVKVGCKVCNKSGVNRDMSQCQKCLGKGYHRKQHCRSCENKGSILKNVNQVIIVPLGMENGDRITMKGRGHQHLSKGYYGDLEITINLSYSGRGDAKQQGPVELKISVADAVLGFEKRINTKEGQQKVKIPGGIQDGEVMKLESPNREQIYARVVIRVPQRINEAEKKIYQQLRALHKSAD